VWLIPEAYIVVGDVWYVPVIPLILSAVSSEYVTTRPEGYVMLVKRSVSE